MDRPQAEKLYDSGKEATVAKLLELDAENKKLKEKIALLEKSSQESSKPPSSDGPQIKRPKEKKSNSENKEQSNRKASRIRVFSLQSIRKINRTITIFQILFM